nr:MAG TPA: hypothetical protein [Caudoviricetes sp.]
MISLHTVNAVFLFLDSTQLFSCCIFQRTI